MLDLLVAPAHGNRLEVGIVVEDVAEIVRVVAAVLLDQARRLDDAQQLGIDLGAVEPLPGNIVERPGTHAIPSANNVAASIAGI